MALGNVFLELRDLRLERDQTSLDFPELALDCGNVGVRFRF